MTAYAILCVQYGREAVKGCRPLLAGISVINPYAPAGAGGTVLSSGQFELLKNLYLPLTLSSNS